MITLFTGMNGAGKTAAMVELLSKLCVDRPLFVHFDPAAKRRPNQVLLSESLLLPHTPINVNDWSTVVPDGAIVVVDEVQDVWRPRGPGSKVPEPIAALEVHRHAGTDFFLTTQAPRLVDANVRSLIGRHVHIRDTGWLGRYWYEWPEVNESMVWKTCPNKKKFRLPKKAFELYSSANVHMKPVRQTPMALYLSVLVIVGALLGAFMVYRIIAKNAAGGESAQSKVALASSAPAAPAAPAKQGGFMGSSTEAKPIDDRVDFIPRVSYKPESAPVYDHLRIIVSMPVVTGAICINNKCKCLTVQGTDAGLSSSECHVWAQSPAFNPYVGTASAGNQSPSNSAPDRAASGSASGASSRAPV